MIDKRRLGDGGPLVSTLGFGTVSLAVDYGIDAPGQFGRPTEREALELLRRAAAAGVTLYDTAPAYGDSEELLGKALGGDSRSVFATKVTVPADEDGRPLRGSALTEAVAHSLARSRARLGRARLDVVQVHNATVELIEDGALLEILAAARDRGDIGCVGVSIYREDEALAALASGRVQMLQVAYNLLDQRMSARVFGEAMRAGVGILVRSAFLKGALTEKAAFLPAAFAPLRAAVDHAREALGIDWKELPQLALRFCLSHPAVASVLVGVRVAEELDVALSAFAAGPLAPELVAKAQAVAIDEDRWLNPSRWPAL